MSHECKPWSHPGNYIGLTWEGWHSAGFGRSRDSHALEESNFQVALAELEKFNTELPIPEGCKVSDMNSCDSVTVVSENHWAVGWIEWIAIHDSNMAAIAKAKELCEQANNYPALDESHLSNLEYEQANEVWKNCFDVKARIQYIRKHRSQFEFNSFSDLLSCVRGKYFSGYANELLTD